MEIESIFPKRPDPIAEGWYTGSNPIVRSAVVNARQNLDEYNKDQINSLVSRLYEVCDKVLESPNLLQKIGAVLSLQAYAGYETFKNPEEITGFSAENIRKGRQVNAGADLVLGWVAKHGVETFAGADLWTTELIPLTAQDMVIRKRWFSDVEILKQNTSYAAKWLAKSGPKNPYKEGPLGVIEVGAYADLILVEGNPLEDVKVLADYKNNIKLVMKNGDIYQNRL